MTQSSHGTFTNNAERLSIMEPHPSLAPEHRLPAAMLEEGTGAWSMEQVEWRPYQLEATRREGTHAEACSPPGQGDTASASGKADSGSGVTGEVTRVAPASGSDDAAPNGRRHKAPKAKRPSPANFANRRRAAGALASALSSSCTI